MKPRTIAAAITVAAVTTLPLVVHQVHAGGTTTTTTTTTTAPSNKVFVCKYTGTPGVDEVLQGGGNPISVAWQPGRDPGQFFNDSQGRSYSLAWDVGQPEPSVTECPPPSGGTTTTTTTSTTTSTTCPDCTPNTQGNTTTTTEATTSTSTTTSPTTSTTTSTSVASTSTSSPPPSSTATSTTSSTLPATSSTTTTTTTSTTLPTTTTTSTTLPEVFEFAGAATVCVAEVPTIRITFGNALPDLAGQTGTLTMADANGNVVSVQPLVYQPGATVDLLYPGTSVNADGSIDDVPGWILTDDGFWIPDPSDAFLRDGITLTYELNPTATATVTYPPESSACANPDGPFAPAFVLPATR